MDVSKPTRICAVLGLGTLWLAAGGCAELPTTNDETPVFVDPSDGRAPFSAAVIDGDRVWLAGVIGNAGNQLVAGGIAAETNQAFNNLNAALDSVGLDFSDLVKCQVFLADIDDFGAMNVVYKERLAPPRPARTTVGGQDLVFDARIEIDCIASRR